MPMNNSDQLHRFIIDKTDIRGEIVTLGESLRLMREHQSLPLPVNRLLAQFAVAISLLSNTLKFDGIITLQARGDGPLPLIMAECSHHHHVRAIARPADGVDSSMLHTENLRALVGEQGVLVMTIDPDHGERYQGIVPLDDDSLAACIEHYFMQSEQLPTRIWLAEEGDVAAGIMLQMLPSDNRETQQAQWSTQTQLADTVKPDELLFLDHETLLRRLFHEQGVRVFEPKTVSFSCSCSAERSLSAMAKLGEDELRSIIREQGRIEMTCEFCQHQFVFESSDVDQLFAPETRH